NARHHGLPNYPIRIRQGIDGRQATVCVANAAMPIASDTEAALFNPFKRSSLNNPRNRTGMGLGLYIAQQIVREHHGSIVYHYDDGEVIFTVRLPLADAESAATRSE